MTDVLVRDVPDDVLAGVDRRAGALGFSRTEYLRRLLAQQAGLTVGRVDVDDLARLARTFADATDEDVMRGAWR